MILNQEAERRPAWLTVSVAVVAADSESSKEGVRMKNCPQCGTPLMRGWCPRCHPNPGQMGAYKTFMAGHALQSIGCLITLVVFVIVPLIVFLVILASSCN